MNRETAAQAAESQIRSQFPDCRVFLESSLAEDDHTAVPTLIVETRNVSKEFNLFLDRVDAQFAEFFYVCARVRTFA